AERPERDALAVRQRASLAPHDQLVILVHDPPQLVDEPALADARHPDERHELRLPSRPRALERSGDELELGLAADERRARLAHQVDAETGAGRDREPCP